MRHLERAERTLETVTRLVRSGAHKRFHISRLEIVRLNKYILDHITFLVKHAPVKYIQKSYKNMILS